MGRLSIDWGSQRGLSKAKNAKAEEGAGKRLFCLPSLLQAKFVCTVQGDLNQCNSMGALEMHQRLEQLKRRIHRVHLYSQGEAQFLKVQTLGTLSPAYLLPLPLRLPSHYSVCQAQVGNILGAGKVPTSIPDVGFASLGSDLMKSGKEGLGQKGEKEHLLARLDNLEASN